jgi:hypothetical protein
MLRSLVSGAICIAVGAIGIAVPASASTAAGWTTRVFQVTYDGSGDVRYHAAGRQGDAGCYISVNGTDSYAFGQLWTIKIGIRRTGPGAYATKIESIRHVDGPQGATGSEGKSGLGGDQTVAPGAGSCTDANSNDTGHFSCTAKDPRLLAVPNPQLKLVRKGKNLLAQAIAFADGFWTYKGSDTIPSDKLNGGCAVYSDTDLTYGAGIFIGSNSITKIAIPVKELANLAKHHKITAPVHFGKNTLHPRQAKCTSDFGEPNKCVIKNQALNGKFTLVRIR